MKVFFTDETNIKRNPQLGFFIYGGIVVDETELRPLSQGVLAIKERFTLRKERPIKWPNIVWGGEALSADTHRQTKDAILDLFGRSGGKIIICLSPQDFYYTFRLAGVSIIEALDRDKQKTTQEYAINTSLQRFNHYLNDTDSLGMVIADDFAQNMKMYLGAHCFNIFPGGTGISKLERITYPVIQLNNEYSQLHQINDVVLGCISHSLMENSENFLPCIKSNFWRSDPDKERSVLGSGFNTYPRDPKTPQLQEDLRAIRDKFIGRLQ